MDFPRSYNYVEASKFLRSKTLMDPGEFYNLAADLRKSAFTISNLEHLQMAQSILDAIDLAVQDGTSIENFRKRMEPKLRSEWGSRVKSPSARTELVYRNGIQSAYSQQRVNALRNPVTLALRPYWAFIGIRDLRQSRICNACNGVVLPANDPWWKTHTPLLHHACRSSIRALTEKQAKMRGISTAPPSIAADEGFGAIDPAPLTIDYSRFNPNLAEVIARRPPPPPPDDLI